MHSADIGLQKKSSVDARPFNSCHLLKFLALAFMLIDHIGLFFMPSTLELRAIGRASAPIWLFFVGYFYQHRDGWKIYAYMITDMLIQYSVGFVVSCFNILLTIIISRHVARCLIFYYQIITALGFISLLLLLDSSTIFLFEYGTGIMLFSVAGALKKQRAGLFPYILVLAYVYYAYTQQQVFQFSSAQQTLCFLLLSLSFYVLKNFELKKCSLGSDFLNAAVLFIAERSLLFYFFHINLFRVVYQYHTLCSWIFN